VRRRAQKAANRGQRSFARETIDALAANRSYRELITRVGREVRPPTGNAGGGFRGSVGPLAPLFLETSPENFSRRIISQFTGRNLAELSEQKHARAPMTCVIQVTAWTSGYIDVSNSKFA
jgi:hypothetical protein